MYKLSEIKPYIKVRIIRTELPSDRYSRRLSELGFIEGTEVVPLFSALMGGIRAYLIKGTVTAVRDKDAECILTEAVRDEEGNGF